MTDSPTAAIKAASLTVTDATEETVKVDFLAGATVTTATGMNPMVDCSVAVIEENPTTGVVCSAVTIVAGTTAGTVVLAVDTTMMDVGVDMAAGTDQSDPAVGRLET